MFSFCQIRICLITLLLLFRILMEASAEDQRERHQVPDSSALASARQRVFELYKKELAAARRPDQKHAMAEQLLKVGVETKDDSAGQYALFVFAKDLATREGDVELALQAVKSITQRFNVDDRELFQSTLIAAAKSVSTPKLQIQAATLLVQTAEDEIKSDRFESAGELVDAAIRIPRKDADLAARVALRRREVTLLSKEFKEVESATKTLSSQPTDPDANYKVGRYRILKGDWNSGLSYLALGNDDALAELARQEISTNPDARSLGDSWWDIADGEDGLVRERFLSRAEKWYRVALPQASGLSKAALEARLKTISASDKIVLNQPVQNIDLAKVNLSGTWRSLATGNEFTLSDQGSRIIVTKATGRSITSAAGSLAREGVRLKSIQWDCVFSGDASKQVRQGTFTGQLMNPNRIKAEFTKWEFDDKGKVLRTYPGHSIWIRKSP